MFLYGCELLIICNRFSWFKSEFLGEVVYRTRRILYDLGFWSTCLRWAVRLSSAHESATLSFAQGLLSLVLFSSYVIINCFCDLSHHYLFRVCV